MIGILIPFLLLIPNSVMACSLPADGSPANCPEDWELGVKSDPTPGTPLGVSRQHRHSEKYSYRPEPYQGMLPDNSMVINNWMGKMKQWELEQTIRDPEFDINNALAEYFNGSNDPTEQEELLQLQSGESGQSVGWRYDRRDDRPWFRPLQKGESESSGSGYTGEEDPQS